MPDIRDNEPVRVKSNGLLPSEIKLEPDHIREQNFKPDLGHQIALVAGYDGQNEHIAIVDSSGGLKVNSAGTSYLHSKRIDVSVDNTIPSNANVDLGVYANYVVIMISDGSLALALEDSTNGSYTDYFTFDPGVVELHQVVRYLKMYSTTNALNSNVTIYVFY